MSWFHSSIEAVDARNHASPAEIVACFQNQSNVLGRLAFLITGDQATADQIVVQTCETDASRKQSFPRLAFRVGQGCDHCQCDITRNGGDSQL